MKKTFCYICMSALLVAGCYKVELNQIDKEIDTLSNTEVASLDAQVKNIKESLDDIPFLNVELKELIGKLMNTGDELKQKIDGINGAIESLRSTVTEAGKDTQAELLSKLETAKSTLETQLSSIRAVIDALQQKYDSLQKQASELEEYADGKFATASWVEGTFATSERQNELIAEVEGIRSMLDGLSAVTVQINDDIKSFIDIEVQAAKEKADAEIAAMADEVAAAIEAAALQSKDSITAAYTKNIADSISAFEAKVMAWVNTALDDYYTIAQAEARIQAYKTLIGAVPAGKSLQSQIDALAAEIAEAKEKITESYQQAIREAIEKSNGLITDEIAEKINDIRSNELKSLFESVESLEKEVSGFWNELTAKESRINTLEEQVKVIKESLSFLDELDMTLQEYIAVVEEELAENDANSLQTLNELISELSTSADGKSLQDEIDALKAYIGTIPTGDVSIAAWIENTLNTLESQYELYATVDYVEGLYKELSASVSDHSGRLAAIESALSTIIEDSKSTIEGWISEVLAGYMDASTFDGKLSLLQSKLEELFADGDETLNESILILKAKISSTIGELTPEYEKAIETAISDFNGFVTGEVEKAFDKIDGEISSLGTEVTGIESTVSGIQSDIISLNSRITTAKNDIATLLAFIKDNGYVSLKALVDALKAKVDALPVTYADLSDFNTVNGIVNGENGYAAMVAEISAFATDLSNAEKLVSDYLAIIGEYNLTGDNIDNLKSIMDVIQSDITTLKTTVFDTDGSDSLRDQVDALLNAKAGILSELDRLEGLMADAVSTFASIAYVPSYFDGMASFSPINKNYVCEMTFEVRPRAIATAVAGSAELYYISTPTRALDWTQFSNVRFTGNNTTGVITVSVTIDSSTASAIRKGASAVLVAGGKYDFASEFVPLYIN